MDRYRAELEVRIAAALGVSTARLHQIDPRELLEHSDRLEQVVQAARDAIDAIDGVVRTDPPAEPRSRNGGCGGCGDLDETRHGGAASKPRSRGPFDEGIELPDRQLRAPLEDPWDWLRNHIQGEVHDPFADRDDDVFSDSEDEPRIEGVVAASGANGIWNSGSCGDEEYLIIQDAAEFLMARKDARLDASMGGIDYRPLLDERFARWWTARCLGTFDAFAFYADDEPNSISFEVPFFREPAWMTLLGPRKVRASILLHEFVHMLDEETPLPPGDLEITGLGNTVDATEWSASYQQARFLRLGICASGVFADTYVRFYAGWSDARRIWYFVTQYLWRCLSMISVVAAAVIIAAIISWNIPLALALLGVAVGTAAVLLMLDYAF